MNLSDDMSQHVTDTYFDKKIKKLFRKIGKFMCEDGLIYLKQCSAGKDEAGEVVMQQIADVTDAIVTAPTVDVRFGYPPKCSRTVYPKGR